jgi:hypothetical protein
VNSSFIAGTVLCAFFIFVFGMWLTRSDQVPATKHEYHLGPGEKEWTGAGLGGRPSPITPI